MLIQVIVLFFNQSNVDTCKIIYCNKLSIEEAAKDFIDTFHIPHFCRIL